MPMTMVRRPRALRRIHPMVMAEMRKTYDTLGQVSVGVLADEVADWSNNPKFTFEVKVNKNQWRLTLKWDRRTKAGKIYRWVSEGTGERGDDPAGKAYVITPKKAKALAFTVPLITKTMAASGAVAPSAGWEPGKIVAGSVLAPGIHPRHMGKELYEHLRSRRSGSFHNMTEAGIKRAFRRLGIWVG